MEVTVANLTQAVLPLANGLAQLGANMSHIQGFGSLFKALIGEGGGKGCAGDAGAGELPAEGAEESAESSEAAPLLAFGVDTDQNELLALFAAFMAPRLAAVPTAQGGGGATEEVGGGWQPTAGPVDSALAGRMPAQAAGDARPSLAQALTAIAADLQVDFDPLAAALRGPWQRLFEQLHLAPPPGPSLSPPAMEGVAPGTPWLTPVLPQPPAGTNPPPVFQQPPIPTEADAVVRSDGNGEITPAAPVIEASLAEPIAETATDRPITAPGEIVRSGGVLTEAADEVALPRPVIAAELPEGVRQIGRAALEQIARGGGEARIRLDPAELGQVTLHVRQMGDRIELDIVAQRPEAAQLLKDHAQDLTTIFGRQGMDLHVQVGLGGRQGQQGEGQQQFAWLSRARSQSDTRFAEILGGDPGVAAERSNRVRGAYNPDGRHIYRI